jgi:hypothetical protein
MNQNLSIKDRTEILEFLTARELETSLKIDVSHLHSCILRTLHHYIDTKWVPYNTAPIDKGNPARGMMRSTAKGSTIPTLPFTPAVGIEDRKRLLELFPVANFRSPAI